MIPAIILARGGSKGLPGKNLMHVGPRSLVGWSCYHAAQSDLVDRVIVSSDCQSIAADGVTAGADKWHLRSPGASSDGASSEAALIEVCNDLSLWSAECIVFLQPTSPLRQLHDIDEAIKLLRRDNLDSVFSGREVEGYGWFLGKALTPCYQRRLRRQDRPVRSIEENGSIYVFRPRILSEFGERLGGKVGCYLMRPQDSFQVDDQADLQLCRELYRVTHDCDATTAAG
jgi:CMP-N-acetylneuraminic acid synthetase